VAKVEWHPGELYPRVGFIVTNLARPAERIVGLLQPPRHRRAVDQRRARAQSSGPAYHAAPFAANAVRLQVHALAYNLGNFMRTLAMPGSNRHHAKSPKLHSKSCR
jgi:hypothetical protein